ncbi:MAG: gamma-glutamyltransferase family protein [Rhodospirillales bacterium]|nr:MAG: gamma-glutamyltransferase family protein [Rhodospirillales bacterium]
MPRLWSIIQRRPLIRLKSVALAFALGAAPAGPIMAREPLALARTHIVAAANPMAVEAGLDILRKGGSAVDAAIAVQLVLGVVEPQASGIGGGGFLLHYDARGRRIAAWDGRETAPAAATATMFLDTAGRPLEFPLAVASGLSIGVPGAMRMLEAVHRVHGRLPWRDLFAPAARLAEEGFPAPPRLARALENDPGLKDDPQALRIFFDAAGAPRKRGDIVRNPALAATLRTLAEGGADALHTGPLAAEIVAAVARAPRPGAMTLADLAGYRPLRRAPLCAPVADLQVCGMGPPSSGPLAVLQGLAMWPVAPGAAAPASEVETAHRLAEIGRLIFADRERWLGDPSFTPVPADGLLDPAYLAGRAAALRRDGVMAAVAAGVPPGAPTPPAGAEPVKPEGGTSHLVVVDRWGDAVSFTTTVEGPFGARRFVGGFPLNNELTDFTARPMAGGRAVANRVEPGKRPRSSMSPVIAVDADGRFALAVGSAGGSRIIGDVLQTLAGILYEGLDMQAAISARRALNRGPATEIERGVDDQATARLVEALSARGHRVVVAPHAGGLHGVRARRDSDGRLLGYEGGADPRRDGVARGD